MYRAAEYPQGVLSPYSGQVHPYPTTKHGPDYTRPFFGMPYVRQPYNVLSGVGAAPGPWLPQHNWEGEPTVQPQPNSYYPHWPQVLGQADVGSGAPLRGVGFGLAAAGVVGAVLGLLNAATLSSEEKESATSPYLMSAIGGGVAMLTVSLVPVFVTAFAAQGGKG